MNPLAEVVAEFASEDAFGQLTVDVPSGQWADVAKRVRDDERSACDYFDWLSAYDDPAADGNDGFFVVAHLWSLSRRHHLLLRTRVPAADPRLPTLTHLWPGAAWHERETFEMFGIRFDGHADLRPLLLPESFAAFPLRKDFPLTAREDKPWPGGVEIS